MWDYRVGHTSDLLLELPGLPLRLIAQPLQTPLGLPLSLQLLLQSLTLCSLFLLFQLLQELLFKWKKVWDTRILLQPCAESNREGSSSTIFTGWQRNILLVAGFCFAAFLIFLLCSLTYKEGKSTLSTSFTWQLSERNTFLAILYCFRAGILLLCFPAQSHYTTNAKSKATVNQVTYLSAPYCLGLPLEVLCN